ncbi:MAG: hypothetical protein ACD_72C00052G0004 [uncultured bacterium]|nr:MAG: hypothetical protein ACD_72C00052G0004 [uncultured bacterium]
MILIRFPIKSGMTNLSMRRNLDNIEIVEPPIEELTKKRSWKGACFTSCALLLILLIGAIIGIKIYVGAGPSVSKNIPANFPADIPIYDKDNLNAVTFISARYKQRGLGIAGILPKIILSPVLYNSDNGGGPLQNLWKAISTPEKKFSDSFEVEWRDVNADPSFVIAYYKKELKKKNFKIDVESEGEKVKQFSFSRADGYDGSIYAQADEEKPDTTYMMLIVNLPKI